MEKTLSIIIPVYNVERYIERCLDTILEQNCNDCEIIVINDGSTDRSEEILKKYIIFDNIKIYKKENGGLSDARNYGLRKSSGKYIMFVDSDDYLMENSISALMEDLLLNKNIYVARNAVVQGDKIEYVDTELFKDLKNAHSKLSTYLTRSKNFCPVWRYVVKKEYITNNNIEFIKGRLHEDLYWTSTLLDQANEHDVYFTEALWYAYRIDITTSITNNLGFRNLKDVFECVREIESSINNTLIKQKLRMSLYAKLRLYYSFSDCEKEWVENFIMNNMQLFLCAKLKYKIFYMSLKIMGAKNSLMLAKKFI